MNKVLGGMLLNQILLNAAYSMISIEIVEEDRIPFIWFNPRDLKEGVGRAKEPNSQKRETAGSPNTPGPKERAVEEGLRSQRGQPMSSPWCQHREGQRQSIHCPAPPLPDHNRKWRARQAR